MNIKTTRRCMLILYVTYLVGGYGWTKALFIAGNMCLPKTALPQILHMVVLVVQNTSVAPLNAKFQGKVILPFIIIFIDCISRIYQLTTIQYASHALLFRNILQKNLGKNVKYRFLRRLKNFFPHTLKKFKCDLGVLTLIQFLKVYFQLKRKPTNQKFVSIAEAVSCRCKSATLIKRGSSKSVFT